MFAKTLIVPNQNKCRCLLSANHLIPSDIETKVLFDVVSIDIGGMWDALNKRIIIKKAGVYLTIANVRIAALGDGKYMKVSVFVNGNFSGLSNVAYCSASPGISMPSQTIRVSILNVNDYIEAFCFHNYGSDLNTDKSTSVTNFSVMKIA